MAVSKKVSKAKRRSSSKAVKKAAPKPAARRKAAARPKSRVDSRIRIFPFLWYERDADKAARFYASIFPDSSVDRITTMQSESPSGPPGSVKVVDFTLLGQRFQAMTAGPHHDFNDAISITVLVDDQAELDRYWNALLQGGQAQACGWLIDRYGLRWQIVPQVLDDLMADPDKARSKRVTDAMLKMIKLDIATLERAARG